MTEYLKEMKPIYHEDKYLHHIMDKTSPSSIANHTSSKDRRLKKSLFELQLSKIYHEKLRNCINGEKI